MEGLKKIFVWRRVAPSRSYVRLETTLPFTPFSIIHIHYIYMCVHVFIFPSKSVYTVQVYQRVKDPVKGYNRNPGRKSRFHHILSPPIGLVLQ